MTMHKQASVTWVIALLLGFVATAPTVAQPVSQLSEVEGRLHAGQTIYVSHGDGEQTAGRFVRLTQESPVLELSTGYLYSGEPLGVFASVGWRPTRHALLVAEATATRDDTASRPFRSRSREWAVLGGARVMPSPPGRVEPFVQVLVGAVSVDQRTWEEPARTTPAFDMRFRTTDVALQYGLGLTWWLRPRVGTQIAMDYRRIFSQLGAESVDDFQLLFGVTFGLGAGRAATAPVTRTAEALRVVRP